MLVYLDCNCSIVHALCCNYIVPACNRLAACWIIHSLAGVLNHFKQPSPCSCPLAAMCAGWPAERRRPGGRVPPLAVAPSPWDGLRQNHPGLAHQRWQPQVPPGALGLRGECDDGVVPRVVASYLLVDHSVCLHAFCLPACPPPCLALYRLQYCQPSCPINFPACLLEAYLPFPPITDPSFGLLCSSLARASRQSPPARH